MGSQIAGADGIIDPGMHEQDHPLGGHRTQVKHDVMGGGITLKGQLPEQLGVDAVDPTDLTQYVAAGAVDSRARQSRTGDAQESEFRIGRSGKQFFIGNDIVLRRMIDCHRP